MYGEQSERSGGGRIIARQSVSTDGECKFPFAVGAFHDVVSAERQGIVAHGQGVVVEALGALVVVSKEHVVIGAVADNQSVVHADALFAVVAFIFGIENFLRAVAVGVFKDEIFGARLHLKGDAAEDAFRKWVHGACQRGILVLHVVQHKIAMEVAVFELGIVA